jgi:N-acetylneuraminic acid mutarotase
MKFYQVTIFLTGALTAHSIIKDYSWKTIESEGFSTERHENAFVECNGKFYLLGGRGIKPVDIYDPRTNAWSHGAEPPVEIHHFQAVSYYGKILATGAMTGKFPDETPLPHMYVYEPGFDLWTIGPEIPESRRRGSAGVAIEGDDLYMISGITDGHNGGHVTWVDKYNFLTREWTELADAPRPRDHFHAVLAKGEIYAFAGRNTSNNTNQVFDLTIPQVDIYNIKSGTWRTIEKEMHIPRAGASVAFLNNQIYIIGGESTFTNEAHREIEIWNLKMERWMPINYLNQGRHGTQAIVNRNNIYIAAGSGNRGGSPELNSLEVFSRD